MDNCLSVPVVGRYAPSPTGRLHVGNLRTAVLAWAHARSRGGQFIIRIEDIDRQRSKREYEAQQLADLEAIGIDWDGTPVRQSNRTELYENAVEKLQADGLTYPCYCTRREILAASSAPHGAPGAYPGTCRDRTQPVDGREPSTRLRAGVKTWHATDELHGDVVGDVDDFILRRSDHMWAYNLAVVVDDAAQGVTEVVRGDDLLSSAPRQAYLAHLLGQEAPTYVHVPLVVNTQGRRLSKRDGDVTLGELSADQAQRWILESLTGTQLGGVGAGGVDVAGVGSIAELPAALRAGLQIPRSTVVF